MLNIHIFSIMTAAYIQKKIPDITLITVHQNQIHSTILYLYEEVTLPLTDE